MKKLVLSAAIALSSLSLAACGGGASENVSAGNEVVADDLNLSDTGGEDAFLNDSSFNTEDLNTLAPVDDPALANGAAPLDNGTTNAL
jgi:hypothetical protein